MYPEIPDSTVQPWVVNDRREELTNLTYEAHLRGNGADVLVASGAQQVTIPPDSSVDLPTLHCHAPSTLKVGEYELILVLKQGNQVLSENSYKVQIVD